MYEGPQMIGQLFMFNASDLSKSRCEDLAYFLLSSL